MPNMPVCFLPPLMWCTCMVITVNYKFNVIPGKCLQYNGYGFLPDIRLSTLPMLPPSLRGTRLNAMKSGMCSYSLVCSHVNVFSVRRFTPLIGWMLYYNIDINSRFTFRCVRILNSNIVATVLNKSKKVDYRLIKTIASRRPRGLVGNLHIC